MAVCRFWQQGHCRYGESCRFEHPGYQKSQNRFAPFSERSHVGDRKSGPNQVDHSRQNNYPFGLDPAVIETDLSNERPIWILSAYGPGRNAPLQLFGGLPRETSFEELRLRHYELASQGLEQRAIEEAQLLYSTAEEQIRRALRDTHKAVRYITDGEFQHPNRLDIIKQGQDGYLLAQGQSRGKNGAFGSASSSEPIFRQSTTVPASISQVSQTTLNPFGGANTVSNQPNPFTAARANTSGPSPFAQPGISTVPNPFAAIPPQANPFASASRSAQQNPFSKVTTSQSLGANTQDGQMLSPPVFGMDAGTKGLSGQVESIRAAISRAPSPFIQPPIDRVSTSYPENQKPQAAGDVSWKGRPLRIIDGKQYFQRLDKGWERISFPEPPQWRKIEELPEELYSIAIEQEYRHLRDYGVFRNGILPELPPKRKWINWNF